MRTENILKHLSIGALLLTSGQVVGQASVLGNAGVPGDYLGWNNTMINDPLMIRHDANQPIDWYTNLIQRMRLNASPAGANINGYAGTPRDGFLLLSGQPDAFTNVNCEAPFSRLHLVDPQGAVNPVNYAQEFGYRPWQKNGVTFTGNSDQGYVGQKYNSNDATDMVIQWSDNPSTDPWASDKLRFIFSSEPNGSATGMRSLEGLEAMRLWPKNPNEVNVGIGDFYAAGVGEPSERVDVVNGKVRVRQLPVDPVSTSTEMVTVNMSTGVLEHRPISNLPDNCEWSLYQGIPPYDHVYTAYGPPLAGCPDEEDRVGIGVIVPQAKLHTLASTLNNPMAASFDSFGPGTNVYGIGVKAGDGQSVGTNRAGILATAVDGANKTHGLSVDALCALTSTVENRAIGARAEIAPDQTANTNTGAWIRALGPTEHAYGVDAYAEKGAALTIGTSSRAVGSDVPGNRVYGSDNIAIGDPAPGCASDAVFGVSGYALDGRNTYGVYGDARSNCGPAYAGYFNGLVFGIFLLPSDQSLKTNVQPLGSAMSVIGQLQPKTYEYDVANHPSMALPQGPQAGLMSNEVEQVLPHLVEDAVQPAILDSAGNVITPAVEFKALNYTGLIPYLIGALQEQNARIDQLQAQVAQCCSTGGIGVDRSMDAAPGGMDLARETDLRIIPNPVAASTQLRYTLATEGRVRLEVTDAMGRVIEVLEEGQRTAGEFTYLWNTSGLAPGTYYCTLLVNGEPLVKRAVKLNER